jgi:hypothetical protein
MTRRLLCSLVAALTLAACSEAPTSNTEAPQSPDFVLFGQPDAGEHPYVGFSIFFDPTPVTGGWFRCSGTLLEDQTTFLTAGHCAFGVSTDVTEPFGDGSGGHDTWVTFAQHVNVAGIPPGSMVEARKAWLNDPAHGFVRGVSIPHPDFGTGFPNTRDVGVVLLDAPKTLAEYGHLPEVGGLNDLDKHHVFDIVGYGLQDVKPMVIANLDRVQGQAKLVNATSGFSGGFNLHLSSNNGKPHRGGLCFGDSGGPVLDGNTVYGVNSFVINTNCAGSGYSYRVDLAEMQSFIANPLE